jgi:uncharacterized protein
VVEDTKAGPVVRVRAKPNASRDAVIVDGRGVRIEVRAAPDRGKATEAVLRTFATFLGVKKAAVSLASGPSSRDKRILVSGLTVDEVRARLNAGDA